MRQRHMHTGRAPGQGLHLHAVHGGNNGSTSSNLVPQPARSHTTPPPPPTYQTVTARRQNNNNNQIDPVVALAIAQAAADATAQPLTRTANQ